MEQLLEAANWAPTHGRTEPWKFVVLGRAKQEELLDLTIKVCRREFLPYLRALSGYLCFRPKGCPESRPCSHYHIQDRIEVHRPVFVGQNDDSSDVCCS